MDLETLVQQCRDDSVLYFGEAASNDLTIFVMGLCGESGEVADIVKKVLRGSFTPPEVHAHLCEELIDVLIYLCNIIGLLQVDVEEVYNAKRAINELRFGGNEPVRDVT